MSDFDQLISREWLDEFKMPLFQPRSRAWRCARRHQLVHLTTIKPPIGDGEATATARFNTESTARLLQLIQNHNLIDPVELWPFAADAFSYEMSDEYHRFYIAETLGYTHIPRVIMTWM